MRPIFVLSFVFFFLGSPAGGLSLAHAAAPNVFRAGKLAEIDAAILGAVSNRAAPGAVVWIERGAANYHRAYGQRAVLPEREAMTEDTIFDAASLTKVLATAPAVMLLIERGQVGLDVPVKTYLPEFTGDGRDAVTVRHLLTHTSGLRSGLGFQPGWSGYEGGIGRALVERPEYAPDTRFRYSDINFILLGELVRRVAGTPLDRFCAAQFYTPLGMRDTTYKPDPALAARIAPTTLDGRKYLRGTVHDPTARRMGASPGTRACSPPPPTSPASRG